MSGLTARLDKVDWRIAIIATSDAIINKAKMLMASHDYDYPVIPTAFDRIEQDAQYALSKGTRVFICRGLSADILKKRFSIPVVPLRFTYYDFVSAIEEARTHSPRIAILGYRGTWHHSLDQYRDVLGDIPAVYLDAPEELEPTLRSLKRQGIQVIVGGFTATELGKKYDLKAVRIGLEDSSVLDSLEEARHLLRLELQHSAHLATVNAILNSASEGMVAVDPGGVITHANHSAEQILSPDCRGQNMKSYLRGGQIGPAQRGEVVLVEELMDIGATLCTVSSRPIRQQEEVTGVVFTFQPVKKVQTLDQNIRKKQADSGNIAKHTFADIIGDSPVMGATIEKAKRFARSDSTVLIMGETGTGKEMFAQSIHTYSARANAPFVAINCAALPQNILESELFGYVKGAFTGANADGKAGYFEMAHTGTIFLDEIGEMPPEMQIKLLRVLQEKEVRRIGDRKIFRVDIRVIAASNKDLFAMVQQGLFREDLYYRLAVLELRIPPLRQRKPDIVLLAQAVLEEIAQRDGKAVKALTKDAERQLLALDWLGNVRQVRNLVERAVVMCDQRLIDEKVIQEALNLGQSPEGAAKPPRTRKGKRITRGEKERIAWALDREEGNRERAAKRLGISPSTLWRRIQSIEETDPGFPDSVLGEPGSASAYADENTFMR